MSLLRSRRVATSSSWLKDNAAKFRHNASLTHRRKKQLASAGGFRRPIAARTNKFQRGYRAKYQDREEQEGVPQFGTIVDGQGKPIDIKNILVSKRGSDDPQERFAVPSRDKERGFVEEEMLGLVRSFLEDKRRDTIQHWQHSVSTSSMRWGARNTT